MSGQWTMIVVDLLLIVLFITIIGTTTATKAHMTDEMTAAEPVYENPLSQPRMRTITTGNQTETQLIDDEQQYNDSSPISQRQWVLKPSRALCEDTYIHAAHRLPNNTVRIYRDWYFWDIYGLPNKQVSPKGPYRVWWPELAPVTAQTAIVTILAGQQKGVTYLFRDKRYWTYWPDGTLKSTRTEGDEWQWAPDIGYSAAYADSDMDGKGGGSRIITFSGIRVYYFDSSQEIIRPEGDSAGYVNGFNESFPPDLTSAFAYPNVESPANYLLYLFRTRTHCRRHYLSDENCTDWLSNRYLFSCPEDDQSGEEPIGGDVTTKADNSSGGSGGGGGHSKHPSHSGTDSIVVVVDYRQTVARIIISMIFYIYIYVQYI